MAMRTLRDIDCTPNPRCFLFQVIICLQRVVINISDAKNYLVVKMFQGTNSNRKINNIIVFVPLETGILLLFNWYDSYNVEMKLSIFNFNCHPVVFYEIYSKVYMVCINNYYSHGNYTMRVYEVNPTLTSSGIENVTLMGPRVTCEIMSDTSSWLNFQILNVEHKIYVAVGNTIYFIVMDALNSTVTQNWIQCKVNVPIMSHLSK